MTKVEQWPPPDWEEVIVTWDWIMSSHQHDINAMVNLLDKHPGGRYHLHGKGERHDFAFRFEDPRDATWFRLNIPE